MKLVATAIQNLADAVNNLAKTIANSGSIQLTTNQHSLNAIVTDLQPVSEATQEEQDLPFFEDVMDMLAGSDASILSVEDEFGNVTLLPAGTLEYRGIAGGETLPEIKWDANGQAILMEQTWTPAEFQVGFAGPAQSPEDQEGPYEVKF